MIIALNELLRSREPLERAWGDGLSTPDETMRRVAAAAVEGTVFFYTEKKFAVGRRDIDWSGGHYNHQEWRAQINRFYWLAPLTAMYRATGDEKYAAAARDYIADWMRAHPTRQDWQKASYDTVLNLCIRVGNSQWPGWLGCLPVLMQSSAFDSEFAGEVVASCRAQLDFLQTNIAGSINWRIANADCLVVSGIRLSFLPEARRWRDFGARVINDAWHRQILPDGAHYERNPSYHQWMARVMASFWRLSRELPALGLVMDAAQVAKMFDYGLAVTRPNGSLNALHDCQGERTGTHPNALREQRAQFRREAGLPDELPPASQFFPDAGQAFLRDSWDEDATYVTFDATNWGGGHCHLSRNSVQLHAHGRTLLPDPGYLSYEASDPLSAHGRSTRAHNTLNLNGWNQDETNPHHTMAYHAAGYDFVTSTYEGPFWSKPYNWNYASGRGEALRAAHHRMLLWLHGRAVIVIDSLYREPGNLPEAESEVPSLEANWQLCEGGKIILEDARAIAHYGDSNLLMLFPLRWPGLKLSLHEGETDPPRGWLPRSHNACIPAPQLCVGTGHMSEQFAEIVTVLVPFVERDAPRIEARAQKTEGQKPAHLTLRWEDGSTDELWWTYRMMMMLGRIGDIETDGGLLHLKHDAAGKVLGGCAVAATYLAPHTTPSRRQPELIVF